MRSKPLPRLMSFVFPDPVRPLELLFLAAHWGWAQFLFRQPQLLQMENYSALSILPAWFWAILMAGIGAMQFAGVFKTSEKAVTIRFVAMASSSGMWTLIAIGFWTSSIITFGAPIYSAFALLSALAGILLGWERQQALSWTR